MRNLVFCLFLTVLFVMSPAYSAEDTPVQSTQGVENFDAKAVENSKMSPADKNEQKRKINRSNEYIKLKKKINKHEVKQLHKEKELEYLEYRLELKRQKLESLGSDVVKGETE